MKLKLLLAVAIISSALLSAQELKFGVGYNYLYSSQHTAAIQTYNFTRPINTDPQPQLMHGGHIYINYLFASTRCFKHGIHVSFGYFRSNAENINFINALSCHFISPGYVLHYDNPEVLKGLYADLTISAVLGGLFRSVNGVAYKIDDAPVVSLGIGGDVNLRLGYKVSLTDASYLSPYLAVSCNPYYYSPETETVINQTKGLVTENWSTIFNTQAGIAFHFSLQPH
jgi:hypothetical protein